MATWQDEQRVAKAVREHRPLSAADRRTAQRLVDRTDGRRWIIGVYAVIGLVWVGLWAFRSPHQLWELVVALVFFLAAAGYWYTVTRRSRADGAALGLVPTRVRQGRRFALR